MRRVLLAVTVVLVLVAAASLTAQAGSALSATTPKPITPGFLSGAMSSRVATAPSTGLRAPVRTALTAPCDGKFDAVSSPSAAGNNTLFSVSAINANDVWAVGISSNSSGFDRTLAEHWNGSSWVIVPTPNPSAFHSDLNSVTAIATNDVWAVGVYQVNSAGSIVHSFAEHWNGSVWALVTSTFNPTSFTALFGVTATANNDVWAVGYYFSGSAFLSLTEHWNGVGWSQFSSQNPSTQTNELFAVSAFNSTDVWAVGEFDGTSTTPALSLAEHWNGSTWSTVSTPNVGVGADNVMFGVTALEANHAAGVGFGNFVSGSTPRLSTAWDLLAGGGSTAQLLSGPGTGDNSFLAVARSGSSVWGVGYWRSTAASARQTLAIPATWDSGTHTLTWAGSPTASDSPSSISNALYAVAAVTPSVFWATGYQSAPATDQTLTELFCGVHLNVSAPATAIKGVPFSVTVTATNADASTATRYVGTVHFSSTDPLAVLPGDYTFVPGDIGSHTFSGVVLNTPYTETITVNDTATPIVRGSAIVAAHCDGACQSAAGTPGSRGVLPGPTPAPPGSRAVLPGLAPGPGTRVPHRSQSGAGSRLPAVLGQPTVAASSASAVAPTRGVNPRSSVKSAPSITKTRLESAEKAPEAFVASAKVAPPGGTNSATNVEVAISLGLLMLALLALRWLRSGEESSVHDQT